MQVIREWWDIKDLLQRLSWAIWRMALWALEMDITRMSLASVSAAPADAGVFLRITLTAQLHPDTRVPPRRSSPCRNNVSEPTNCVGPVCMLNFELACCQRLDLKNRNITCVLSQSSSSMVLRPVRHKHAWNLSIWPFKAVFHQTCHMKDSSNIPMSERVVLSVQRLFHSSWAVWHCV